MHNLSARRICAASALALFTAAVASAQIGIGVQAGVLSSGSVINFVENGNEEEIDTDNVTGLLVGIPVEIAISNVFSIQPELNYLRRGYKVPEDLDNFQPEQQSTYNVLELPILAKLGYTTENFTVAATLGPSIQYVLGGTAEVGEFNVGGLSVEGSEVDIDFDSEEFENIDRTNVYGLAGLQFGIPIGFGKFLIDGRYRFSLREDNQSDDDTFELNVRDRGLSLTAGIMVTLGDY